MIVKEGKELVAAIAASVFLLTGLIFLLTPLRDSISRHGLSGWLIGVGLTLAGLILWVGVIRNLLARRRG